MTLLTLPLTLLTFQLTPLTPMTLQLTPLTLRRTPLTIILGMARILHAFEELSGSRKAPTSAMQEKKHRENAPELLVHL